MIKPPSNTKCEEASTLSHAFYIACGQPAVAMVKNRDPKPYAMYAGCADHNIHNRGAHYVTQEDLTPSSSRGLK